MRIEQKIGLLATAALFVLGAEASITEVRIEPRFFNPTIGQEAVVTFATSTAGRTRLSIRDRDGFAIREIEGKCSSRTDSPSSARKGLRRCSVEWDGRDSKGRIVADEAYAFKVEAVGAKSASSTFDSASGFKERSGTVGVEILDVKAGSFTYRLEKPSRVHIQIGQAVWSDERKRLEGPVLRTLVDRQVRCAGLIHEVWNGKDETGLFDLSTASNLHIGILASDLPDLSLIAVGNTKQSFLEYALSTRPSEALIPKANPHAGMHHAGLDALEDGAPPLIAKADALWRQAQYVTSGAGLDVDLELQGPRVPYFTIGPTTIYAFVDEKLVATIVPRSASARISISREDLPEGRTARVSFNWASASGPAAVTAIPVLRPAAARAASASSGKVMPQPPSTVATTPNAGVKELR